MSRAARLGLFIIATLAILAVGIFIIGSKQYLFSSTYQLKSQFSDVVVWTRVEMCEWAGFTWARCAR